MTKSYVTVFLISHRTKIGETAYDITSPWTNASLRQAAVKTAKATSGPSTRLTTRTSPKGNTIGVGHADGSAALWASSHTPSCPLTTPSIGSRGPHAGAAPQAPSCPTCLQGYIGVGLPCRRDATPPTTLFYRLASHHIQVNSLFFKARVWICINIIAHALTVLLITF